MTNHENSSQPPAILGFDSMIISDDHLHALCEYLDKEMSFQGAASTVSGAAGAWILKELVFSADLQRRLSSFEYNSIRVAALLLLVACGLFLIERGRLARIHGQLVTSVALKQGVEENELKTMVRKVSDRRVVEEFWPYYLARLLLLFAAAIGAIVMFLVK